MKVFLNPSSFFLCQVHRSFLLSLFCVRMGTGRKFSVEIPNLGGEQALPGSLTFVLSQRRASKSSGKNPEGPNS